MPEKTIHVDDKNKDPFEILLATKILKDNGSTDLKYESVLNMSNDDIISLCLSRIIKDTEAHKKLLEDYKKSHQNFDQTERNLKRKHDNLVRKYNKMTSYYFSW
jgi:hypothetical protein